MSSKPHLEAAHTYWKECIKPGDTVIDATCGNGHDTLVLARLALEPHSGLLYAMDIQEKALQNTRKRLAAEISPECLARVHFIQKCHSEFPSEIKPNSVKVIVYNLGYLPGGDKTLTTRGEVTLQSIAAGLKLLKAGGMISLTLYPGHAEGKREEQMILDFVQNLDEGIWQWQHHRWGVRETAPSLLLVKHIFTKERHLKVSLD